MKAKILPLEGKYYGTEVEVTFDLEEEMGAKVELTTSFNIWCSTGIPSWREMDRCGYSSDKEGDVVAVTFEEYWEQILTQEQKEKFVIKENLICDCHYESEKTYTLVKIIVDAINAKNSKT